MKLQKNDLKEILIGSSLLGTGGGGRYILAEKILQEISSNTKIASINEVSPNELIITAFMLGGLKKKGDLGKGIAKSISLLKNVLKKEISYLIPVEIGPTAVMNIFNISSNLNLPVIDGDLVGYRAAPEIYVEAITLNNVNRLPIAAVNLEGDSLVLYETSSIANIETILRTFSAQSKSEVYVAGYPIFKKQIKSYFGESSLSFAKELGRVLSQELSDNEITKNLTRIGLIYVDTGLVVSQKDKDENGFTKGKICIKSGNITYDVFYKNEFLVLLKNNKVICTSPDSILILDNDSKRGINNGEKNTGKTVSIFLKKAIGPWRTLKGRKLFSPKELGYKYQQKIIK